MDTQKFLSSLLGHTIQCVYLHPVRLELVFSDGQKLADCVDDAIIEFEDGQDTEITVDKKMIEKIKKKKWDWVPFKNINAAIGCSDNNGNTDRRGGGCGNLDIPVEEFTWTEENPLGITLKQYTEIVYRLKGSKYDYWYELYGGLSDWEVTGKCVEFTVELDYGS